MNPKYWLTPCVQMPGEKSARTVVANSTRDLDDWHKKKPQAPKGSVTGVKIRLTMRPYVKGEIVSGIDATNVRAMRRFIDSDFAEIPDILPSEQGTDVLLG